MSGECSAGSAPSLSVELQKLQHDRAELITRMVQPALWLLIFGQTFSHLRVIDTGGVPYLAFLAPGIIAQSALFISIFYGIQIIWDRDAGILDKLMVTPAPPSAPITGKAFAAGVRSVAQVVGVLVLAYLMGVHPRRRTRCESRARWAWWCWDRRFSHVCR